MNDAKFDVREVRSENHVFPEKVTNPEKGSNVENPENGSCLSRHNACDEAIGLLLDGLTVCLSISEQLLNLLTFCDSNASKTASRFNWRNDCIHKLGLRTRRRLVVLNNYV